MDDRLIKRQLSATLVETEFEGIGKRYRGKVRDTYALDGKLILITTDRISAFDHILPQTIPFKGQVLNRLAGHFFNATSDIVPNHVIEVPDPNVTIAHHCEPIPVEFVVRGYLAGHAWRTYKSGARELCGKPLPHGLRQNSRLPEPILTPATKARNGHDEDTTRAAVIGAGTLDASTFDELEQRALGLFRRGTEMARSRGLILVDTKYEFGWMPDGSSIAIDEIHTPDSSRYFYADTYEELLADDQPQRQLSKEFVREWLMDRGFMGQPGQELPNLTDEFRLRVARRYIELFETVTGSRFVPDTSSDPVGRIEQNLAAIFAESARS